MKKERLHLATPGCVYFVRSPEMVKKLLDTGNFSIIKTYFEKHKWWELWKIKNPVGYEVICNRDLEI